MLDAVSQTGTPRLSVKNLHAQYGESKVLHGISFDVQQGELVCLLGRNGAGKTTTLRAIMGLLQRQGQINFDGRPINSLLPHRIARLGVGYVPEERGIFSHLSVTENLLLPPITRPGGMSLDEIYTLFPNLKERANSPGTKLSGGEQQMLAMARILRTGADFLLLDEVTEGLAPVIVEVIGNVLADLKRRGLTMILVEQNFHFARKLADRHIIIEEGSIVETATRADVEDPDTMVRIQNLLGV